jgi:heme/copper-type cytochrome/quinol oxidase subunit 2
MSRVLLGGALAALVLASPEAQEQAPNRRTFEIVGREHRFTPDRLEVSQDDLVRITLRSEGQTYTFAIDAYRVVKRAAKGQAITFEFRADQPGSFEFYCNLTSDPGCRDMKGTLVVKGK